MSKNELAEAITALTGESVNPDSHTRAELLDLLAAAQGAPTVRVRLGDGAPVGALVVGGVRIERELVGEIAISDYEQLRDEYRLIEE